MPRESSKVGDFESKYRLLYDLVLHESKAVWDTGQLFLIANTFLAAIIGTAFPDNHFSPIYFALLIIGLVISVLWHFSYQRTRSYYHFRIEQAKQFEKNNGFEVFSGDAEILASGGRVKVNNEYQDLKVYSINFPSLVILGLVIKLFIFFYLFTIVVYSLTSFKIDTIFIN